ncbi:MAG: hypothetical protein JKY30_15200 [Flavobacteriales bacterium]|nr:hypothetical protein [Flavobacteriales bacterium]
MVASSDLTLGLDSKYQSYSVEEASVEIGWDNWGGFMVIAIDKLSEKLVLEISECLVEYE